MRSERKLLLSVMCSWLSANALSACDAKAAQASDPAGSGIATDDRAGDTPAETAGTRAAGSSCSGALPVMTAFDVTSGSEVAADWSCSDSAVGSEPSPEHDAVFRLNYAPAGVVPTPGVTMDFYFSNSTLGHPDFSGVSAQSTGALMLSIPRGTSALSVVAHAQTDAVAGLETYESHEYDVPMVGTNISGASYLQAGIDILPSNVIGPGAHTDLTKATIFAALEDCGGRSVGGAEFELIDGQTQESVADGASMPGAPRAVYFQFALPGLSCTHTSIQDGVWMMLYAPINVSAGTRTTSYRLRVSGRKQANDVDPVIIMERELELFAGAVTALHLKPISAH